MWLWVAAHLAFKHNAPTFHQFLDHWFWNEERSCRFSGLCSFLHDAGVSHHHISWLHKAGKRISSALASELQIANTKGTENSKLCSWHLYKEEVRSPDTAQSKIHIYLSTLKSALPVHWFHIHRCTQPQIEHSTFSSPWGICGWEREHTVSDAWLVESADVKPHRHEGWLYLLKKPTRKWTHTVQTRVVHRSTGTKAH